MLYRRFMVLKTNLKMMNKSILFSTVFFACAFVFAQQQPVSSGGNATSSSGSVSYSVGQFAYQYTNGSSGSVNEGVQQSFEVSSTLGTENLDIHLEMQVYPNPVAEFLTLRISNHLLKKVNYRLYDVSGKLLKETSIKTNETQISFENYPKSSYLLQVFEADKILKIFKIIKK